MAKCYFDNEDEEIIFKLNKLNLETENDIEKFTYENVPSSSSNFFNIESTVIPLEIKHAIHSNEIVLVNDEKGFYVDEKEEGIRFTAVIPEKFAFNLDLKREDYENLMKIKCDESLVYSFGQWINDFKDAKPESIFIGFSTLRNLIHLPFQNNKDISHNKTLYINFINGKLRINGLSKTTNSYELSEESKKFCYRGEKISTYVTSKTLNGIPINPEEIIPSRKHSLSFVFHKLNNLNFYYLCNSNCFKDENTLCTDSHVELRVLIQNNENIRKLRNIKNWDKNRNPLKLKDFPEPERRKILYILYRKLTKLIDDWIKLFLLGTQNFHVFIADKYTGITEEYLIIERKDIEDYFEYEAFNRRCFTAQRAKYYLHLILSWILKKKFKEGDRFLAEYNPYNYTFSLKREDMNE